MRSPSDLLRVDGLPLHRLTVAAESRTPSRPTLAAAPRRAVHSTRSVRSTPAAASPHSPPSYRRWSERPPLCPRAGHDTSRACGPTVTLYSHRVTAVGLYAGSTWYRLFLYGDRRRPHNLSYTQADTCHPHQEHSRFVTCRGLLGSFIGRRARETCASPPHGRRGRWRCWR